MSDERNIRPYQGEKRSIQKIPKASQFSTHKSSDKANPQQHVAMSVVWTQTCHDQKEGPSPHEKQPWKFVEENG
jgi:hypothetical protein